MANGLGVKNINMFLAIHYFKTARGVKHDKETQYVL
jgi:hypothetical protein